MIHLAKKKSIIASVLSLIPFFTLICHAEPSNISLVKKEAQAYYESGHYEKDLAEAIKKAQTYIMAQAAENQNNKEPKKLAIVLDIDETSLSNYPKMVKRDFTGTQEQFHQEVMAADAPAILPTLALYQEALNHGIKVFFVTGRSESEREATRINLLKAGYSHWSGLYLRPSRKKGTSIIPFKSHAREKITQKGYTIIASIGDQYSDLKGGYAQKGFKLPNPYYFLP